MSRRSSANGRGVIRDGYTVLKDGAPVSIVASGGFSPTLGTSIAMAYLPLELAAEGTTLDVDVRGRMLPVEVVPRPFVQGTAREKKSKGAA